MKNLAKVYEDSVKDYLRSLQVEHSNAIRREKNRLKEHAEILSRLSETLFKEKALESQYINSNNVIIPNQCSLALALRSAHFQTFGFSDFWLNRLFSANHELKKSSEENISSANVKEKGFNIERKFSPVNPDSLFESIRNSHIIFKSSVSSKEMNGKELMEGLSFNKDNGTINFSHGYNSSKLGGRWVADLGKYIQLTNKTLPKDELNSSITDLASSVIDKIQQDDLLSLSCKFSPIQITRAWCFLNNPQTAVTHNSSQALMWHSDYHGSSFVKVFIPITSFSSLSGGHQFIPSSHLHKPLAYEDTRYKDEYINNVYGIKDENDQRFSINLSSGDILIENTSGIHKGIPPTTNPRLLVILLIQNGIVIQ